MQFRFLTIYIFIISLSLTKTAAAGETEDCCESAGDCGVMARRYEKLAVSLDDINWKVRLQAAEKFIEAAQIATTLEEYRQVRIALLSSLALRDKVDVIRWRIVQTFAYLITKVNDLREREIIRKALFCSVEDIDSSTSHMAAGGIVDFCETARDSEYSPTIRELSKLRCRYEDNSGEDGGRIRSTLASAFKVLARHVTGAEDIGLIRAELICLRDHRNRKAVLTTNAALVGLAIIDEKIKDLPHLSHLLG